MSRSREPELTRLWWPTFWACAAAITAMCASSIALLHVYALLASGIRLTATLGVETALAAGLDALGAGYLGRARIALNRDALVVTNVLRTHVIPYAEIEAVTGSLWGLAIARTGHRPLLAVALPLSARAVRAGIHTREGHIAHAIRQAAHRNELDHDPRPATAHRPVYPAPCSCRPGPPYAASESPPMTTPHGPTVLITPGTPGIIRPRPDGQIDARTLQTRPHPADRDRILITTVGAAWCSEFDALPITEETACAPGSLILTYGRGAAPGATSPAAAVLHLVEPDGELHVAGIWLNLTDGWIEFLRPTVALAARLLARSNTETP